MSPYCKNFVTEMSTRYFDGVQPLSQRVKNNSLHEICPGAATLGRRLAFADVVLWVLPGTKRVARLDVVA